MSENSDNGKHHNHKDKEDHHDHGHFDKDKEREHSKDSSSSGSGGSGGSFVSAKSDVCSSLDEPFDIRKLLEYLEACKTEDDEINLDFYLKVFQQLYRFFCLLGTVFTFVASDVKTKVDILKAHQTGENASHYMTIEKMMEWEKSSNYITENKTSNGSRTLLRLHRSLDFVSLFLSKTVALKKSDGTGYACKDAYNATISKYHPWLIQKGARLAMYSLPTKQDLYKKVCCEEETSSLDKCIPKVIDATRSLFDHCEKLYIEKELHELP